jgi:hypothetical protein
MIATREMELKVNSKIFCQITPEAVSLDHEDAVSSGGILHHRREVCSDH